MPDAARRRRAPAEQRLEQRRLAGAVRPDQRDMLAALERELAPSSSSLSPARSARPSTTRTSRPDRGRLQELEPERAAAPVGRVHRAAASSRLICFSLRLRLFRLARLRPEALDEALEPRELLGLARRRLRLVRARGRPARAARRARRPGSRSSRPRSSSSTAVVTASRNQRSCATRMTAASIVFSIPSSHSSDSMSRWFVGSSSSRMSGCDGERARERGARQLAAGEGLQRPVEVGVGEPEPAHDRGGAVAPVVAAGVLEPRLRRRSSGAASSRRGRRPPSPARARAAPPRRRPGRRCPAARSRAAGGRLSDGGRWSCSAIRVPFSHASSPPSSEISPRERAQQRRLPGAVRPGERQPVAPLDLERDAVEEDVAGKLLAERGGNQAQPCAAR